MTGGIQFGGRSGSLVCSVWLGEGRKKPLLPGSEFRVRQQNLEGYLRRCKGGQGQGQGRDITARIAEKHFSEETALKENGGGHQADKES